MIDEEAIKWISYVISLQKLSKKGEERFIIQEASEQSTWIGLIKSSHERQTLPLWVRFWWRRQGYILRTWKLIWTQEKVSVHWLSLDR